MAVDRWFIGGGAEHTPESARRLVYASTAGAEGTGSPTDLRVLPLAVPGQGVRVTVGSALIKSNYVGGETQTYMGTVYSQEEVEITPTGSTPTTGRSDLVVMRVEDPFAAGSPWPEPDAGEIALSPYVYIRVIPGVPANTKRLQDVAGYQNDTAITLARLDIPRSTGTITSNMIVDLRSQANPRRLEMTFGRPRVGEDDTNQRFLTGTMANGGEYFPGGGGSSNEFKVTIPKWANYMLIEASWMSIYYGANKNPYGRYWIEYGDEYRNHTWPDKKQWEFGTQHFNFNAPLGNDEKTANWLLMDTRTIPSKLKGKETTFVFKAGLSNSPGANSVWMNWSGGLGCRIVFAEETVAPMIV